MRGEYARLSAELSVFPFEEDQEDKMSRNAMFRVLGALVILGCLVLRCYSVEELPPPVPVLGGKVIQEQEIGRFVVADSKVLTIKGKVTEGKEHCIVVADGKRYNVYTMWVADENTMCHVFTGGNLTLSLKDWRELLSLINKHSKEDMPTKATD